jgi:hypothetical protein
LENGNGKFSVFPKFPGTNIREVIFRNNFRELISGNKFPVPKFQRNKLNFSISVSNTGTGKSICLIGTHASKEKLILLFF